MRHAAVVAIALLTASQSHAAITVVDTWRGADAALKILKTKSTEKTSPLVEEIAAWKRESATLAPAVAATRYVALVDKLLASSQMEIQDLYMHGNYEVSQPAALLPPPASWPAIRDTWRARAEKKGASSQDAVLALFGDALVGDRARLTARAPQVAAQVAAAHTGRDPGWAQKMLDDALKQNAELSPEALVDHIVKEPPSSYGGDAKRIPDLVTTVGEGRARDLLLRLLAVPKLEFLPPKGSKTLAMARQLALENNRELASPHWALVRWPVDSTALYEAMEARFVHPDRAIGPTRTKAVSRGDDDYTPEREAARTAYLVRLLVEKRADAPAAFKRDAQMRRFADEELPGYVTSAGASAALADVLEGLLKADPSLPLLPSYRQAALRAGRGAAAIDVLKAARRGQAKTVGVALLDEIVQLELALDRVEPAIADNRQLLRDAAGDKALEQRVVAALSRQVDLAVALKRDDLFDDVVRAARAVCAGEKTAWNAGCPAIAFKVVTSLVERGAGPRAEAFVFDRIRATTALAGSMEQMSRHLQASDAALLVYLYVRARRAADAQRLLDDYDGWNAQDVRDIGFPWGEHGRDQEPIAPFPVTAAEALMSVGHRDDARAILQSQIREHADDDRAYELLVRLDGSAAIPFLEERAAADPFEERPLIWKALLLGQAGNLSDAERAARAAIAVDPLDREQGRRGRLRSCAVLAEVLGRQGGSAEAAQIDRAISATRAAEDGDRLRAAGLLTRAVGVYEGAAKTFENAYCIHSRLAVELEALGKASEARAHYERAFALMPQSFGRVESHCFGCEGVFDSPSAQEIAEQALSRVAVGAPNEARARYLFGYLRKWQGRSAEAAAAFRDAARLDPDYLNAYVRLLDVAEDAGLSTAEREQVALQAIRLDKGARYQGCRPLAVTDLVALWNAVATHPIPVDPPEHLYVLRAAQARLERENPEQAKMAAMMKGRSERFEQCATPAGAVAQHPLVQAITSMLQRY